MMLGSCGGGGDLVLSGRAGPKFLIFESLVGEGRHNASVLRASR